MNKLVIKFILFFSLIFTLPVFYVFASNPVTPILPSDNIQDPGDPGTSWEGCGPTDSNCYVTITGGASLSELTAATTINTIDNLNFAQQWNWSTASTQTPLTITADALSSGSILSLTSNGTATINTQKGLNISLSGTSATNFQSSYGIYSSNTHGTNGGNYAGYYNVSGGLVNYGLYANASGSNPVAIQGNVLTAGGAGSMAAKFYNESSAVGTGYGLQAYKVGGGTTAVGGYFWASDSTNNYAIIVPSGGGTVGIGTSTPGSKLDVTTNNLGTTQTATSGLALVNTTSAAAGAQQISPAIRWSGNGWATTGSTSQSVDMRSYLIPIQGTSASSKLAFEGFRNGASQGIGLELYDNGRLNLLGALLLNSNAGLSGQVLTSAAGAVPTWTTLNSIATTGLTSGSGTTASGTAANLGGTLSANTTIDTAGNSFEISNGERGNGFLSDYATRTTKIGDIDGIDLGNIIVVDSVNSRAYYDNIAHTGKFGIGNDAPSVMLHVGSTSITDATNLLRLEDENSTCDFNADAGGPSCGSDRTLKKDITSLDTFNLLTRISALNPVSYHWNTDDSGDVLKYGFIAQEVAEQFPDLVTDHTWIDGTTRKFLNTGGLMPYAIGAIKEMNLKITGIDNFDQENNSFGEKLRTWFANASNRITRIFTGEICLTDPDGTSECINKNQLGQLKQLLNSSSTSTPILSDPAPTPTPNPILEPIPESQPEAGQLPTETPQSNTPTPEL